MNPSLIRLLKYLFLIAVVSFICVAPTRLEAQCLASGDFDGSAPLTVADYVACIRFIVGFGPAPANLYELDLNGDCMVDAQDAALFECYFTNGWSCFPQFPVPTCCNPDTTRGACCTKIDSCAILNPLHCTSGYYQGDGAPCGTGASCPVVCGDVNGTGTVTISDVIGLIVCIFSCGPGDWLISGDANCSGSTSISDAVYLIRYIFAGGPAPCASCP